MAEKQRVMIVDDDANIAELISLYLAKECYETKIVYDGEEVWCCGDGSETPVLRKVKENVDVKIPKNISVISAPGFEQFTLSLDSYLNDSVYKMTPVFNGTTIEKLYDSFINYAG